MTEVRDPVRDLIDSLDKQALLEETKSQDSSEYSKDASDNIDPCFRKRADAGAVFSSSCCPPRPGLAQSCEIPFGAILTPLAPYQFKDVGRKVDDNDDNEEEALMCINCLAYLNIYASIEPESNIWTCPLCGQKNVAPPQALDMNAKVLKSPIMEYRRILPSSEHDNFAISKNSSTCYIFVLDANLPTDQMQSMKDTIINLLDSGIIDSNSIIGIIVYSATVSVYQIRLGFSGICSADVYPCQDMSPQPVDEMPIITNDIATNRAYLAPMREAKSSISNIMKAIIGGTSQDPGKMSLAGDKSNGTLSRKEVLKRRREARLKSSKNRNNASVHPLPSKKTDPLKHKVSPPYHQRCTGTAVQIAVDLATSSSCNTGRILLFTNGCPNIGVGSVTSPHLGSLRKPVERTPIGEGGQSGSTSKGKIAKTRIDTVDPTMIDVSIDYFKYLGQEAFEKGIGIDVFCAGNTALGVPAMQSLVAPSSGYTLPHHSLSDSQFKQNLLHSLKHTRMSKTTNEKYNVNGCILDLRMPSFIYPSQAIGPGEGVNDNNFGLLPSDGPIFSSCAALAASEDIPTNNLPSKDTVKSTLSRLRMGRFDPLATFSIMLQVAEDCYDIGEKHAFFQFVVRYMDTDGVTLVTRIYSHRLSIARTTHDFLDGIDEEIVPVLLGREAVLRSMFRRDRKEKAFTMDKDHEEILAEEAKKDLDTTIQNISTAYRMLSVQEDIGSVLVSGETSTQPSLDFAFPPELVDALHMLHHLRRGLLVDTSLYSAEDRAVYRDLFLRLPLEDNLFMMTPSLLSIRVDFVAPTAPGMEAFEHVPPETLVLWDNVVIAGDHFDNLFVWSGRALPASDSRFNPVRKQCESFLLDRAKHRFPAPTLHRLSENDSMERRFTSRLVPSHLDPPEQQIAHFPSLTSLSENELRSLRMKFRFYDDSSDASFRRWFWSTARVSSKIGGASLCE